MNGPSSSCQTITQALPTRGKFDDEEGLLTTDDENIQTARVLGKHPGQWQSHVRPALIAAILIFIIVAGSIVSFVKLQETVCGRNLPVGLDYTGGFVPKDVNAQPQLIAPDISYSQYEISSTTFESTSQLNETIMSWNRLAPGASFVLANQEAEWHGNEVPLKTSYGDVFQIAALHQMHCLTTILRDYALLQMGYTGDQLYDNRPLKNIRSHSAHCFNEIRRALTCLSDATAIGHGPADTGRIDSAGKIHVCNNYNALLEWVEDSSRKLPDRVRGSY